MECTQWCTQIHTLAPCQQSHRLECVFRLPAASGGAHTRLHAVNRCRTAWRHKQKKNQPNRTGFDRVSTGFVFSLRRSAAEYSVAFDPYSHAAWRRIDVCYRLVKAASKSHNKWPSYARFRFAPRFPPFSPTHTLQDPAHLHHDLERCAVAATAAVVF